MSNKTKIWTYNCKSIINLLITEIAIKNLDIYIIYREYKIRVIIDKTIVIVKEFLIENMKLSR
jgi:hypothetical protein